MMNVPFFLEDYLSFSIIENVYHYIFPSLYVSCSTYDHSRIRHLPPQKHKEYKRYRIMLVYNYGADTNVNYKEFHLNAGELTATLGPLTDKHIICTFNKLSPALTATLRDIYFICAEILMCQKYNIDLYNFTSDSPTTTGFPYFIQNGSLTLKLSLDSIRFIDPLGNPISVSSLQNSIVKLYCLFHLLWIKITNSVASLVINLDNAIVLSVLNIQHIDKPLKRKTDMRFSNHMSYIDCISEKLTFSEPQKIISNFGNELDDYFIIPMRIGDNPILMTGCEFSTYGGISGGPPLFTGKVHVPVAYFIECVIENDVFFDIMIKIYQRCEDYVVTRGLKMGPKRINSCVHKNIELYSKLIIKVSNTTLFTTLNGAQINHNQLYQVYFRFIPILGIKLFYTEHGYANLRFELLSAQIISFDYHDYLTYERFTHHLFALCHVKRESPNDIRKWKNQLRRHNFHHSMYKPLKVEKWPYFISIENSKIDLYL